MYCFLFLFFSFPSLPFSFSYNTAPTCFQADAVPKEYIGQMTNSLTRQASGAESKAAGVAEMHAAKGKGDEALRNGSYLQRSSTGELKSDGEG
jgi:hypothetical protein